MFHFCFRNFFKNLLYAGKVVLDGNCDLYNQTDATKQHRNLSIVAMSLYLSRGGLVWILNVVLLGWILSLAVQMAVSESVACMLLYLSPCS